MYLNEATIIGNLTRDPEVKALPSGKSVANFSVATNSKYKGSDGQMVESVEYHNIVVYGVQAENAGRYLKKGSQVLVKGKLQTRSWEKDGVKQYRTEINAQNVTFGRKADSSGSPSQGQDTSPSVMPEYPEEEINPEDIPF